MKKTIPLICGLLISWSTTAQDYGRNGMVVSDQRLASEIGIEILRQGGNAVDAAVATAFALAVAHPQAGNIGGGGFMVFMDSASQVTTIDFREKAPLAASRGMFLDENGELPEGQNAMGRTTGTHHVGLKSVGVPGTVAGLFLAHQKYGVLPWQQLVQPAIEMAATGIPMPWDIYQHARYFREHSPEEFMQNFFNDKDGKPTEFGATWKQPELAQTLMLIRDKGHDGFYAGPVAEEIERYMKANGGLITREDLSRYQAIEREPVKGSYKGFDIYSMGPPSSGGTAILEMLNMLELAGMDSVEFGSATYVHLVAEVMRRAYADRAEYLGDIDFDQQMPIDELTSKEHAMKRFSSIDYKQASVSDSVSFGQIYEGDHTTHFSVIDQHGNAVSLTYTIEHAYGSGMGSPNLGFIFNNEMGDFNPIPGFTSSIGYIGTLPNQIEPEKRMLSSMSPTIVANDGRPYLIIGSPGGRTIINTVFQTVLAVLEYEMQVDRAIEALKIHHQWLPDVIRYEEDQLSPDTRKILESMGHELIPVSALGVLMGIQIDVQNQVYIGAADSCSASGAAVGY